MALLLLAGHHRPRGVPEKDRKGKKLVIPGVSHRETTD